MFQIIAEAISLAAHASGPRPAPRREGQPPARPVFAWPRQG